MHDNRHWRWLALAFSSLGLLACAVLVAPATRHPAASEDFAKRLRWLDYSGAAQYMSETVRGDFLERFAGSGDLRIVEFVPERVEFRDGDRLATAWYVMEYNLLPSSSVRLEQVRLDWEYQGASNLHSGTWRIVSKFPDLP
jgi:hypothetical protein